jgi:ankyrin repeat protein
VSYRRPPKQTPGLPVPHQHVAESKAKDGVAFSNARVFSEGTPCDKAAGIRCGRGTQRSSIGRRTTGKLETAFVDLFLLKNDNVAWWNSLILDRREYHPPSSKPYWSKQSQFFFRCVKVCGIGHNPCSGTRRTVVCIFHFPAFVILFQLGLLISHLRIGFFLLSSSIVVKQLRHRREQQFCSLRSLANTCISLKSMNSTLDDSVLHEVSLVEDSSLDDSTLDEQLFKAVRYGKHDDAERIVKDGANVNATDTNGVTPIHIASEKGHTEIVRFLVNNGADVHCKDTDGDTPLHDAADHGRLEIVRFLVSNGSDINCKDREDGNTPLHLAVTEGHTEIVRFLVKNGANVHCKDTDGDTPLHDASRYGNIEAAFILIGHGADMSINNNIGKTPLEVADTEDVALKISRKASTLPKTCPAAIQDKLEMPIQENKQRKAEISDLQDTSKSTIATLSEQHKKELASVHVKLNLVIQENKQLKSAKSLAGPKHAKIEAEAEQATHEMIFNLIMKRKQLQDAGFSAIEIDEQLPLPRKDDDEPDKKKCRSVGKTEEET